MPRNKFFLWHDPTITSRDCTDGCTMFPDHFLWIRWGKPCILHDRFNRGCKTPQRDHPSNLWELQCVFWTLMIRQINNDVSNHPLLVLPHFILAYLTSLLVWLTTFLSFRFWFRFQLE